MSKTVCWLSLGFLVASKLVLQLFVEWQDLVYGLRFTDGKDIYCAPKSK